MDTPQKVFLAFAAIVVLYQSFRGWRLGPVRQLIRICALALGYADAYAFSAATVPFLRFLGLPDFLLQVIGGVLLGTVTYVVILTFGCILFKKTSDQRSTLIWFLYGTSGSLIGIVLGLVLVLGVAVAIRLLGTLADGASPKAGAEAPIAAASKNAGWFSNLPSMRPSEVFRGSATPPQSASNRTAAAKAAVSGMAQVKRSLDQGVVGEVLLTLDPVPKDTYEIVAKIGQLTSSPTAIANFLSYPGAKELLSDPEIIALRDDPEIAKQVQTQNLVALAKNPKMQKVCNNPKMAAKLRKFDLQKALDYALAQ